MKDLAAVFSYLHDANASLEPSKCGFAANKDDFLDFELSQDAINPQDSLTATTSELPIPQ